MVLQIQKERHLSSLWIEYYSLQWEVWFPLWSFSSFTRQSGHSSKFEYRGCRVQQYWESRQQRREGKVCTHPKMNDWLTTINMLQARRPASNTPRSIRVFIMYGYWSLMRERIVFHIAYVSTRKTVTGLWRLVREWDVQKVPCVSLSVAGGGLQALGLQMDVWRLGAQSGCDGTHFSAFCYSSRWI